MGAAPIALHVALLKGVPVLVVEDSWCVAKEVKWTLEQVGMHVLGPTPTTAEARRLIAVRRPTLAVVDINLKHETTCGLIGELHDVGVRVVVISGYEAPPISKDRVVAFLKKPFCGAELIAALSANLT